MGRFGYAQELFRSIGGFSNFAISFSTISILTGVATLYGYGLEMGGPFQMTIGWPLATFFTLAIAASMASHCQGCLDGHIKKALKFGATTEELSETIAITMGVAAASMVDLTDIASANLRIRHFDGGRAPEEPREVSPEE